VCLNENNYKVKEEGESNIKPIGLTLALYYNSALKRQ
jgi:hypothetical protein